jgi:hypothetical protein
MALLQVRLSSAPLFFNTGEEDCQALIYAVHCISRDHHRFSALLLVPLVCNKEDLCQALTPPRRLNLT